MNPHGGSIALGEPYGAAGARLTTTALITVVAVAAGGKAWLLLERTS